MYLKRVDVVALAGALLASALCIGRVIGIIEYSCMVLAILFAFAVVAKPRGC